MTQPKVEMKRQFSRRGKRRHTGFFSLLLALLGLGTSSCIFITPCMYGTPNADFSIKGKVIDESGNPIPGLRVILGSRTDNSESVIYDQNYWPIDTVQTGTDGIYYCDTNGFPISKLQIDVSDIDGEQNVGNFNDTGLVVKEIQYSDENGWYRGRAEINVPDIVLKKK